MICYVLGDCWIVSSGRKCWQTLIASGGLCFKPGTHCFNQISGYFKAAKQLEVHVRPSQAGWKVGKYSRSWKALLLGWQRTWRQHRFDWLETLWTPSALSLYNLHPARSASAQNLNFCKLVFALFLEILVSMQAGSWRCSRLPKHVQTWSMQPPSHLFSSKKKRVEPWPGDVAFLVLHLKFLFDARLSCEQSHLSFPELVSQWKSFPALQGIVRARSDLIIVSQWAKCLIDFSWHIRTMQWQRHCIQNKIQGNCWRLTVLILCVETTMEHFNGSKTERDWKRCWANQLINCVTNKQRKGKIEIQRRCTDQLGGKTSEGGNEGKPVLIRPTMPVFNGAGFRCTRVLSHLPQCSTMYNNGGALRLGGSHIFPPPQIDRPVRFVWQYL